MLFQDINKNPLICAIYSQPKNSDYYSEEIWEEIECDIINPTDDDPRNPSLFCIIGDMNGRVGVESEFVSTDTFNDNIVSPTRNASETTRRNCDKVKCRVGEKIIHLCKSYDLQIANGRFPGDLFGNFTHHNKNKGQSNVDLALISDALMSHIEYFKILPQPKLTVITVKLY